MLICIQSYATQRYTVSRKLLSMPAPAPLFHLDGDTGIFKQLQRVIIGVDTISISMNRFC